MVSYYNKVEGTLETGKTARADDIHLIQSSIHNMIQQVIVDLCGTGFILGESENALKLYATNLHVDQSNLNYNEQVYWVSFYDKYLRQPLDIDKSSIETVRVHMINDTNITTTVYAEIRDEDFELLQEANASLAPSAADSYNTVDFNFNLKHLQIGRYYFVIRPVDISATDLAQSTGDEVTYTTSANTLQAMPESYTANTVPDTIVPENFCIRYDADGNYNKGLEASFDGETYLMANLLEENLTVDADGDTTSENNPDLYFEEVFSSGNTYLIDNEAGAVVLGEKVYPLDTHVTIDEPSDEGNRIDLVTLTTDGQLVVTKGIVYTDNEEKKYPTNDTGLNIAYITNYKASENRIPTIEQDDDNNVTRHRDILERIRRLEKHVDYQAVRNAPTRIQFTTEVDPILANNGVDEYAEIRGEGTYNMGTSKDAKGNQIVTDKSILNYAWSIIKNNYTYNVQTNTTENGKITVWDTYTTSDKKGYSTKNKVNGIYSHHIKVTDHSKEKATNVSGLELKVQVKKGGTLKKSYTVTTNKKGEADVTFFKLKLAKGTYSIYTIYGQYKVKSKLVVVKEKSNLDGKKPKTHELSLSLPKVSGTSVTHELPTGVIAGNDSFYIDNVDVDVNKGEVRVKKISNISDSYETNNGNSLLKDSKKYDASNFSYKINTNKKKNKSKFPALHITFDREVYIKSITPYIAGFKNISSFGIILFKNDVVYNNVKNKRKTYKKKIGAGKVNKNTPDDSTFPTLYKSKYVSLKDLTKKSGNYQVLKKQVTFDNVNLDLEAGTYTIMICPKLAKDKKEGEIKIKEYDTRRDTNIYGTSASCTGDSHLSTIYMGTSNLTDRSWDIEIKHKTYKYYDTGILESKPINTGVAFSACNIVKNFVIPKNCSIKLFVSNNGGSTWIQAKTNHVTFKSSNTTFRWKMEMHTNNIATPKLKFNNNRQNAINFSLMTTTSYVEYEDYGRCYETPLMNANTITRNYTRSLTENAFTEWEFARLFMQDEELNSKIDILISYAHDNYKQTDKTDKASWGSDIFFTTVFADLTLNDFNQESVDYDNYEGNVEYDEHNYRFLLDTTDVQEYTGGLALAAPDNSNMNNNNADIVYGDINTTEMKNHFAYKFVDVLQSPYEYYGNDDDSERKYSGMHICGGPYVKATRIVPTTTQQTSTTDTIYYDDNTSNKSSNYQTNSTQNNALTYNNGYYVLTNANYVSLNSITADVKGKTVSFEVDAVLNGASARLEVYINEDTKIGQTLYSTTDGTFKLTNVVIPSDATSVSFRLSRQFTDDGTSIKFKNWQIYSHRITTNYTSDDTIIGVRFTNGLDINDNMSHIIIGLMPHVETTANNTETVSELNENETESAKSKSFFPKGTFKVAISLGLNGEIDPNNESAGKEHIINKDLYSDEYTEVTIDLLADFPDLQGEINSIAIKAVNPDNTPMANGDFIGIGRIMASPYNRRPYVPYVYTGRYDRYQWQNIISDSTKKAKAQAYVMYALGRKDANTVSTQKIFYPIDNAKDITNKDTSYRKITSYSENIEGQPINRNGLQVWGSEGTNRRRSQTPAFKQAFSNNNYIERKGSQIHTKINGKGKYVSPDTGNQLLFQLPSGTTGNLFKIKTNIPYTIYDLVEVEYYIFSEYWKPGDPGIPPNVDKKDYYNIHKKDNGNVYLTDGSFSKGEIFIDLYDTEDIESTSPIDSFALPAWGRVATRSEQNNKIVHAWFKKRSSNPRVRCIVLRRENPRKIAVPAIKLMLHDIIFFNTETEGAFGPQMQMRIYPNNTDKMTNTHIRKIGGIYRI